MSKENTKKLTVEITKECWKKLTVEITKECWKKLKVVSINKEVSLNVVVKEVLEKFTNKKSTEENKNE